MKMREERLAFAGARDLLLAALTDPVSVCDLTRSDLDLLVQLARRVRLHGRLCAELERSGVLERLPVPASDQLKGALTMAESRVRVAIWELDCIARALRDEPQIPVISMKGCAYVALGLPNAAGRVFSDVDLLVPESQLQRVEALLNRHGWHTKELTPYDDNYYRSWAHELPPLVNPEREVEIDLHHSIAPPTSRLQPDASRLIERTREVPGSRFRVLATEDLVLHAMVHLMYGGDQADGLRDLVDIADMIRHFSAEDADFWRRFQARCRELGLTRPAYYGLRYAARFLGVAVPDGLQEAMRSWAPPRPVRWLMDRLVPRALFPPHPEYPGRTSDLCRLALYIRSHWVSMPPWLLAYHLTYKFCVKRLAALRKGAGRDAEAT